MTHYQTQKAVRWDTLLITGRTVRAHYDTNRGYADGPLWTFSTNDEACRSIAQSMDSAVAKMYAAEYGEPMSLNVGEALALGLLAAVNAHRDRMDALPEDVFGKAYAAAERLSLEKVRYVERQIAGRALRMENWL
jgi:hypothetical protein